MIRIGIPRALLYYQYYPAWCAFFAALGAEVVISPATTQAMVAKGSARVVTDTCLPVKVFCGHVLSLVDKCDYIFVPAIRSVRGKAYNCSKFLGLPDMTKAVIPESPPILEIEIDVSQKKRHLYRAIYELGRHFTWNPLRIRQAANAAMQAHREYRALMPREGLTPPQAMESMSGTAGSPAEAPFRETASSQGSIAIIGHPYLIYDEHINYRLLHWLEQAGYKVLTAEMVGREHLDSAITRLVGRAYWTYEEEIVGAGGHYLESGVSGVIGIMTFGCGPDSVMMDMVRRHAARLQSTPFISLTLDEHTAEAGLITRLEAFLDMIQRRKRRPICV